MTQLSIVLINYNSSSYTKKCIESLKASISSDISYDIIVVDNASEEKDYSNLKSFIEQDKVNLISSNLNTGFATGNMLGFENCNSKYVLFLNNDTLVKDNFIQKLFNFMKSHPECGLCGGQMFNENGEWVNSFGNLPSLWERYLGKTLPRILFPQFFKNPKQKFTSPQKVGFVSGSDLFVRSDVFKKVGGLDKDFFLYCEEEDLGLKMYKAGYTVYYIPDAHFIHYCGVSTGRSLAMDKEFYISFKLMITKHFGKWGYLLFLPSLLFKHAKKIFKGHHLSLFLFILKGSPEKESIRYEKKIIAGR